MSSDLRSDLAARLVGQACIVGIGNPEWGDDGVGVELAQELRDAGCPNVIVAGTTPEARLRELREGRYDSVLLLDAVEYPGAPGSVVLLDAAELKSRFPQVSTHKLSLGTLASLIRQESGAKVCCLGVRPVTLAAGGLSGAVNATKGLLKELLLDVVKQTAGALDGGSAGPKSDTTPADTAVQAKESRSRPAASQFCSSAVRQWFSRNGTS